MIFETKKAKPFMEAPGVVKESKANNDWKYRLRKQIYTANLKQLRARQKKPKTVKEEEQKRKAAMVLESLLQKDRVLISDHPEPFPYHGNYSSYIPLSKQSLLLDELENTFPYLQYLTMKDYQETRISIYHEISSKIRESNDKFEQNEGWKNVLKKYLCQMDILQAIECYVAICKYGSKVLNDMNQRYSKGCDRQVFLHKQFTSIQTNLQSHSSVKLNKNVKTTIDGDEKITEVTLPKTSKLFFCAICLIYDCGQHALEERALQNQCQYISKQNKIQKAEHVFNILKLINFARKLERKDAHGSDTHMQAESSPLQEGEERLEQQDQAQSIPCSENCYKLLTQQKLQTIRKKRRPIVSPLIRSLIKMAVQIFSYEPCTISMILHNMTPQKKNTFNHSSCEGVFVYFLEEGNIEKKLQRKLHNSELQMLQNQQSTVQSSDDHRIALGGNQKKFTKNQQKLNKQNHMNRLNYKVGNCHHHFLFSSTDAMIDPNCEECCCKSRGFCLPECMCSQNCPIRKRGCDCRSGKDQCRNAKKCPCFENDEQCIPGVCKNCFDHGNTDNKKNSCRNDQILRGKKKLIKIGQSNIEAAGLGAFAGEDIEKDELITIYSGEIIEQNIDYIREGLSLDLSFYNFGVNDGGALDARYMGNKSRFFNHQEDNKTNIRSCVMFSQGTFRTVFYSTKNIKKGEEMFFNYDGQGKLSKDFKDKYPFIGKQKK